MNGAQVIASILKAQGVEFVPFYPASELAEALAEVGIRLVLTRQERVAGNIADGISRSTGGRKLGVWNVQHSAGAENAYSAVAHSFTDSTPTLFLPGSPPERRRTEHPTFDNELHYRSVTKLATTLSDPSLIGHRLRQAFSALQSGRPQPVVVGVPDSVARGEAIQTPWQRVSRIRSAPDPGGVREAADRILLADNPLIWAGNGVLYSEGTAELVAIADLIGAPVMTTLQGKSAFPETHPLSAGVGGHAKTDMVVDYLRTCDLLIAVGTSLSQSNFTPTIPDGKTIIHCTNDPRDLNKAYKADVPIAADATLFLEALARVLSGRVGAKESARRSTNVAKVRRLRRAWIHRFEDQFSDTSAPINGYRMFRELWATVEPSTTMITHESGASRDIQSVFYRSTTPHSYLGWGHSSQLGFSLGLAMGAKLANPDKLVINVMGDGAIGMTGMDFETAVREQIPILTVVKHDSIFSGYGEQMPESARRYGSTTQTGDYAGLAMAMGGHAERVATVDQLRPAFERAIAATRAGQPALVDVVTSETTRLSV